MVWGDDTFWLETREFIKQYLQPEDRVLAPNQFKAAFQNFSSYDATYRRGVDQFEWILFHKGVLSKVNRSFLKQTIERFHPVFANAVFVVFAKRSDLAKAINTDHFQAFLDQVNPHERLTKTATQTGRLQSLRNQFRNWFGTEVETQANQLSAVLDGIERIDRNTAQLHLLGERVQHLEKIIHRLNEAIGQLQQRMNDLEQSSQNLQQISALGQQSIQNQQIAWLNHASPVAQMSWQAFQAGCRAACQTTYLGNDTLIGRVLGKYLLYADSQDRSIVPHLCLDGFWETWMTLAVARVLQPGWNCIDVGANHGYYTLLLAEGIGATGRIIALEPNPRLADLLRQTIEVNGFAEITTVMAKAAIDKAGAPIKLVIPPGRGMNASIMPNARSTDEVVEVETTSIDELTQDWATVDFIKIDAEGAEEMIWQGLQQTLQRHPSVTIVLEFNCGRYPDPKAFLETIQAAGFELRHIDFDAEIKPLTLEQSLTERSGEDWLLFLQKKS